MSNEELIISFVSSKKSVNLARQNLVDWSSAEDVVQETAVLALMHLPEDHPFPGGWLSLTLKRLCWSRNRQYQDVLIFDGIFSDSDGNEGSLIEREVACEVTDPTHRAEVSEDFLELADALYCLKEDERTAILLHAAGYGYKEIARSRGWTYTKVNRCLHEGKGTLRRILAEWMIDELIDEYEQEELRVAA